MKRLTGKFNNLLVMLIPMAALYGLVAIISNDSQQRGRESAASAFRVSTDVTAGQARGFESLPDGNYIVDCVLDDGRGVASIRLVVPTGDISYLVRELPPRLRGDAARFRKTPLGFIAPL